tara:strand:- start:358 stop:1230 length:873 start_codon:yes stop_codon:yes gene_type:complete
MRYVVRSGEDINAISERYRVDPAEVASLNFVEDALQPGDIIEIPSQGIEQAQVPGYSMGGLAGNDPKENVPGKPKKPPIFGQPMPDAGMKKPTMGQVKPPPQRLSPKNYAQEQQAKKRLRGTSGSRPGMMRPQGGQQPGGQQQSKRGGTSMLDQLWSNLGPQAQGFAEGGPVPGQDIAKYEDIYGKKMAELRSSGETGQQDIPRGGIADIQQGGGGGSTQPQIGGPPMGQPMGPMSGGPPPAGGMPKPPISGGIASVDQAMEPLASAVKDSTESVMAGIMAASSLSRSGV